MTDKIATRDAYGRTLVSLGKERTDIVVLEADLSKSTKTAAFGETFPERFFNMGIAEADMMGTAAGLATSGFIPFASTFAVFATGRAYDQIRNSIAYTSLNVKIAATHAGLTVGEDGASHQALEDIALMRVLPNMTVLVPADGPETERVLQAVVQHKGPVYIRLGRPKVPVVTDKESSFMIGKGQVLRSGKDVAIISCGMMVAISLEAAALLSEKGIEARVINMASLKPLDEELILKCAEETGALVTAEEHSIIGGLGSAVAEITAENYPVPLMRVGIKDTFGESGSPGDLLKKYHLTAQDIVAAVERTRGMGEVG